MRLWQAPPLGADWLAPFCHLGEAAGHGRLPRGVGRIGEWRRTLLCVFGIVGVEKGSLAAETGARDGIGLIWWFGGPPRVAARKVLLSLGFSVWDCR